MAVRQESQANCFSCRRGASITIAKLNQPDAESDNAKIPPRNFGSLSDYAIAYLPVLGVKNRKLRVLFFLYYVHTGPRENFQDSRGRSCPSRRESETKSRIRLVFRG